MHDQEPAQHRTGCVCKTCEKLRERVTTAEAAAGRYEIVRVTEDGEKPMGWQMHAYGGLIDGAMLWPGTKEVIVRDRCREFVPDTLTDNPGGFTIRQVGPLRTVRVCLYVASNGAWNYSIVLNGGAIYCGAETREQAEAAILLQLERMFYLFDVLPAKLPDYPHPIRYVPQPPDRMPTP